MAKILVTGGAGYVGSICCRQLIDRGYDVVVLDDLSTGHAEAVPKRATLFQFDYGDRARVDALLRQFTFDAVFHFAAKALIAESVANPGPFFADNVASGIAFLEALRRSTVRRFVFSSSAAVYGNPDSVPTFEDHPTKPVNSYGESKLIFERILQWYAQAYKWNVVAFRYFNAAGATSDAGERHHPETHIIPLLLEVAAGERECFHIYGDNYATNDGTCIRDFVHVSDIAAAHLLALTVADRRGMSVFNIGSGRGHSVREVIRVAEQVTQRKIPVHVAPRRPGDPAVLCASPDELTRELGWKPLQSDLRQIINSAWQWKQRHPEFPNAMSMGPQSSPDVTPRQPTS
jgi:UDP-glucose 4-epimerase